MYLPWRELSFVMGLTHCGLVTPYNVTGLVAISSETLWYYQEIFTISIFCMSLKFTDLRLQSYILGVNELNKHADYSCNLKLGEYCGSEWKQRGLANQTDIFVSVIPYESYRHFIQQFTNRFSYAIPPVSSRQFIHQTRQQATMVMFAALNFWNQNFRKLHCNKVMPCLLTATFWIPYMYGYTISLIWYVLWINTFNRSSLWCYVRLM